MNKLKVKMQFIVASMVVVATGLAMTIVVAQQQPNTPFDRGDSSNNPIEIPHDTSDDDTEGAGGIETTSKEKQDPLYWHYVYIHNNSGTGEPGPNNKTGSPAKHLTIQLKNPVTEDGRDGSKHKRKRIVVDEVKKKRHDGSWTNAQKVEKQGEKVVITLDEELAYCETLEVKMRVEVDTKEHVPGSGSPGKWRWENSFGAVVGEKSTFNIVDVLTGGQKPIERAGVGGDPAGDSEGDPADQGSIGYMFDDLDPELNLAPTSIGEGDTGTFAAPDLVFSERHSWSIPTGTLRFFATGGASFNSESSLQVIARDVTGADAVMNMDVGFGTPSVVNGVIQVPVNYRNPEAEHRIAIMVRGAEVDVPELAGGTVIRYAVGGISAGPAPVRMPAMLRVGAEPESYVFRTHASLEIEYTHPDFPEDPGVTDHRVGWYTFMARPHASADHIGYVDAIVIGEPEAGHIRGGSFEITNIDPFNFVASQDTKLYVLHADDYSEVEAFDGGSIEVTASGAIRVALGQRGVLDTPVVLVILNPKVNMGQGPFTAKQSGRVAIAGDALRGGFQRAIRLVKCDFGTSEDFHLLPDEPLVATQLTPLAQVQPE